MPYTGSVLTTDTVDVDQYMMSSNEEFVCLQNGTDSECLTLIPKETKKADSINGPIIHIHPERLVYMFYHEDKEIVRLEKAIDTTEIVETLTETKEDLTPQTDAPSGDSVVHDADDTPPSDPLPQISDPPGDGTQPSDPPQQPQDPPSSDPPPPPPEQPRSSDPPPPPPPDPPNSNPPLRTPPPQPTNQDSGGDGEPDSTNRHHTPNAIYYDSLEEWYVTIYYPENYKGPRGENDDFGFTITFLSNGTITKKELTHNGVRIVIETTAQNLSVQVKWTDDPADWNGDQPPKHYLIQAGPGGPPRIMINMQ